MRLIKVSAIKNYHTFLWVSAASPDFFALESQPFCILVQYQLKHEIINIFKFTKRKHKNIFRCKINHDRLSINCFR